MLSSGIDHDETADMAQLCHFIVRMFSHERKLEYQKFLTICQNPNDFVMKSLGSFVVNSSPNRRTTYSMLIERLDTDLNDYLLRTEPPVRTRDIEHFWQQFMKLCANALEMERPYGPDEAFSWKYLE